MPNDRLQLLSRAADQCGAVVAAVRPDQAALPTPCSSWDVRALVNHVVGDLRQFTVMAGGGEWTDPAGDLLGDDWNAAYRSAAEALLAAWNAKDALDPKEEGRVGLQISDLSVHAWDVAKATGQSTDLDPDLGRFALEWGRQNLHPEFRGSESEGRAFAHERPAGEGMPLYSRVAAFYGRDPA